MDAVAYSILAKSNSGVYIVFSLNTSQDVTSWLQAAYVYSSEDPSTALAQFTLTKDNTAKTITAELTQAQVAALLPVGESQIDLAYDLLVKPNTAYGLRFFYGEFKVLEGGPEFS